MACIQRDSDSIIIKGGNKLWGKVKVQGSKNSSLPILAATLLVQGVCTLKNIPDITDVYYMCKLLEYTGCVISMNEEKHTITLNSTNIKDYLLPGAFVKQMRSSVILLGAMLGRMKEAGIDYPGGCVIGERPIDLHLMALERLGASIRIDGNYIHARTEQLTGARIEFPFKSVGATQNAILAAVLANGRTVLDNASREPEVEELCRFLQAAGAKIDLSLEKSIVIDGVDELHPVEYEIVSDRIVAGTYLFTAMAARGEITLENAPVEHMKSTLEIIRRMGGEISICHSTGRIFLRAPDEIYNVDYVETREYPGFPTDMQSQLIALACTAKGTLTIKENIFSNRFKVINELRQMGADISCENNIAVVKGVSCLDGRHVIAMELRGGAALCIAGIAAKGITVVSNVHFIDRGYEDIVRDISALEGTVER